MKTISQKVNEIVTRSPFLFDLLSEDILNLSALARRIEPEIKKELWKEDITLASIVMALRRLQQKQASAPSKYIDLSTLGDITVRSKLALFTYENSSKLIHLQKKLLEFVESSKEHFLNFSQGLLETTIIVNATAVPIVEDILLHETPLFRAENLSCITVRIPPGSIEIPGYVYSVMKPFAMAGINLVDITSLFTEITFTFEDSEVDRAFSVLKQMKQYS